MRAAAASENRVNEDTAAVLRRAIAFAGLFGLAGAAAIACTARTAPTVPGADRLLAQEARWTAESEGTATIAVPSALHARRHDPAVAAVLAEAQRQLDADRSAAEARRDAVIRRMDDVRADRDLHDSQRSVLGVRIDQAYAERAGAQVRGDAAAVKAVDARLMTLRIQAAKSLGDAALASRTLNALNAQVMALVTTDRQRAAQRRDDVRRRLNGA